MKYQEIMNILSTSSREEWASNENNDAGCLILIYKDDVNLHIIEIENEQPCYVEFPFLDKLSRFKSGKDTCSKYIVKYGAVIIVEKEMITLEGNDVIPMPYKQLAVSSQDVNIAKIINGDKNEVEIHLHTCEIEIEN